MMVTRGDFQAGTALPRQSVGRVPAWWGRRGQAPALQLLLAAGQPPFVFFVQLNEMNPKMSRKAQKLIYFVPTCYPPGFNKHSHRGINLPVLEEFLFLREACPLTGLVYAGL